MTSPYMTRREVAEYLRRGVSTIDRWISTGRLQYVLLGRRPMILRTSVEAMITEPGKKNGTKAVLFETRSAGGER